MNKNLESNETFQYLDEIQFHVSKQDRPGIYSEWDILRYQHILFYKKIKIILFHKI